MSKHKRATASSVERLTSGGLSVLMLVVSFYLCHCSLLCFFGFLSYIKCYLSKTKKRNKKTIIILSFLCIMAYVKVLSKENVSCVFSFCDVKNELVVY